MSIILNDNYKNYTNKLSVVIPKVSVIPKNLQNTTDPFKPFFKCPYGFEIPYRQATDILDRFDLYEIKELRSIASKIVLKHVDKVVIEANRRFIHLVEKGLFEKDVHLERKHILITRNILIYFLNMEDYEIGTYTTTTGNDVGALEIFAILAIKFISKGIRNQYCLSDSSLYKREKFFDRRADLKARCASFSMDCILKGFLLSRKQKEIRFSSGNYNNFLPKLNAQKNTNRLLTAKAKKYWEDDTSNNIRLWAMTLIIKYESKYLFDNNVISIIPKESTIRKWIRLVAPKYALIGGNISNQEKEIIKVVLKEKLDIDDMYI